MITLAPGVKIFEEKNCWLTAELDLVGGLMDGWMNGWE
jgi:hypothetical protein